jgi:hypothetical protein
MAGVGEVIQGREFASLSGLQKRSDPRPCGMSEPEKSFLFVAAMGNVRKVTWQEISIRSRHGVPLHHE